MSSYTNVIGVFNTPVFRAYCTASSVLVLKMLFMSPYTSFIRIKNKAVANPEDSGGKFKVRVDENVERVRRAHLNDVENIPLFFVSAFMYTLTGPSEYLAKSLFLAYTAARFAHTFVYAIVVIPQPARFLSYVIGSGITMYMTLTSLLHFAL